MFSNLIARATLFHGRPQAGVVTLSEHCLADGRRSVHAARLSVTSNANGALATGPCRVPYATFRKVVTGNLTQFSQELNPFILRYHLIEWASLCVSGSALYCCNLYLPLV